jgi:O-6-methylguanine DNA methyltransferase
MKEQILPPLPIVGKLRLKSRDGKTLASIDVVVTQKSSSKLDPFFQECFEKFHHFLLGKAKDLDIPIDLSALTPFQLMVLKEMKKIPYGEVKSYKDLAIKMKSKGYQAIGTACGKNPLMLIYPCHRVVGSKNLGGFAHGLVMKKALLKLEGYPIY